jgi:hypothetical protein
MPVRMSWAALLICVVATTADAQGQFASAPLSPPLSQYGPLRAPSLQTRGLAPDVRRAVETALGQSAAASTKAMEAEAMMRAARRAAGDGREAALSAERGRNGHGNLKFSLDRETCRYSGQVRRGRASGVGVMRCGRASYEGQFRDGRPEGLVVIERADGGYIGQYRRGRRDGLGGDYARENADAYEGEYRDGARMGLGIERDKDGFYPGQYGFFTNARGRRINMELSGTQDFRGTHWAGTYGAYSGPKILCRLIKGAVLEGSVLDGDGAKFDARGRVVEQGHYRLGILENGKAPPC